MHTYMHTHTYTQFIGKLFLSSFVCCIFRGILQLAVGTLKVSNNSKALQAHRHTVTRPVCIRHALICIQLHTFECHYYSFLFCCLFVVIVVVQCSIKLHDHKEK